jgi:LuxR family maltose regulon positive regulatory protein
VPYAVLAERPELAIGLAGARAAQGRTVDVRRLLHAARLRADGLSEARAARLGVHHGLIEGACARSVGELDAAVRAYAAVPLDVTELSRWGLSDPEIFAMVVRGNLGTAEFWTGDLEAAEEHLLEASDRGGGTPALPHLNASAHLALLACEHGELDTAEERARAVVTVAAAEGWSRAPQVGPAYLAIVRVLLDRGEPEKTDVWLGRLADVLEVAPEPHVLLAQSLVLATRRDAGGDTERALAELRAATLRLERWRTPPRPLAEQALLREADLLARAGDARAARALAQRLGPPSTDGGLILAARLHLRLEGADAVAGVVAATTGRHPRTQTCARIVAALTAAADGDDDGALEHLEDALLAAAPFGLRGPFLAEPELAAPMARLVDRGIAAPAFALDLIGRLSGINSDESGGRQIIVEPLTEREHTMLRYLASALSNAEIARELYVSVNTVKTHQRSVYRKLGAVGRRDAVRRARVLALL